MKWIKIWVMQSDILHWMQTNDISGQMVMQVLFSAMVAILFLQSGLDKIFNWQGEKSFYESHFKKTFLKNSVGLLMPVITISETFAGALSLLGLGVMLFGGSPDLAILGMFLACLSVVQLFFGQRIAKDYGGAASLVPYFFLTVAGLYCYLV